MSETDPFQILKNFGKNFFFWQEKRYIGRHINHEKSPPPPPAPGQMLPKTATTISGATRDPWEIFFISFFVAYFIFFERFFFQDTRNSSARFSDFGTRANFYGGTNNQQNSGVKHFAEQNFGIKKCLKVECTTF